MIPIHDSQRSYSTPYVTILLIAVNALVFLFQLSLDPFTRNDFVFAFGLVPDRFHWSAVFTSMFMHGGWMHLIGNMLFLWIYGDNVEDILGHGKYLLFYLLCGAAAAFGQYAIAPESRVPMVGASGAIAEGSPRRPRASPTWRCCWSSRRRSRAPSTTSVPTGRWCRW